LLIIHHQGNICRAQVGFGISLMAVLDAISVTASEKHRVNLCKVSAK